VNEMDEIKQNMRALYNEVRSGKTDLKTASELANIAGKFLKAEQLKLAREVFANDKAETRQIASGLIERSKGVVKHTLEG